jgi:hypothetical protein
VRVSWPWLRGGAIVAALVVSGAAAAACSSGAAGGAGGASGPTGAAPAAKVYSLEGHSFVATFPSRPDPERDPPAFSPANGLPVGTRASALDVGQLGSSSQPHSYGVIVAQLPPSSSVNLVAGWFRALASGLKPTRIDGYHGVRHVSIVKKGSATYFGGFELLQDGHAFFVLGAYDPSLPAVNRFLDSFSIRS